MIDKLEMELLNWRVFEKTKFAIPEKSFLLTGSNGSGKTSFLAAFFSLWTGASFGGKMIQYLKADSQYLGITTNFDDWFLTGKIGPHGRLQSNYSKPKNLDFDFFSQNNSRKTNNSELSNFDNLKLNLEFDNSNSANILETKNEFEQAWTTGKLELNQEIGSKSDSKNNSKTTSGLISNIVLGTKNKNIQTFQNQKNLENESLSNFKNDPNLEEKNSDLEKNLTIFNSSSNKFQNWPTVLTYVPSDNTWFELSRSDKLGKLDQLLGQIYGVDYQNALTKFNKNLRNKQKFLANCLQNNTTGDPFLAHNLAESVYQTSLILWQFRQLFWQELDRVLMNFSSWLLTKITKMEIKYQVNNFSGVRQNVNLSAQINQKSTNWQGLWSKETIVGQVLFGAHRDDFEILVNSTPIQNYFSRGEMRLFVLFIKNLAVELIGQYSPVIGLFDDVFGELDLARERILFDNLLTKTDYFIATSAQKILNFENTFELVDLII